MARLYLNPGSQTYGPVPGGDVTMTFGSNLAEKVTLAHDAHVIFDPSFVRGNDCIVILGNAGDYDIAATVAGITITSAGGANIHMPGFGNNGGIKIDFYDASLDLGTSDQGVTFSLEGDNGIQELSAEAAPIAPGSAGFSLDIGSPTVAAIVDAGSGDFAFSDNAERTTNVMITKMEEGDSIEVTNAVVSDYNFNRDFSDINDLFITYTDPGTGAANTLLIDDILPDTGAVNSFASATAAIGFDFLTFA